MDTEVFEMKDFNIWKSLIVICLSSAMSCCTGNLAYESDRAQQVQNGESPPTVTASRPLKGNDVWKDRVVTAGVGTDSVRLGMSRDELGELLGKPSDELDYNTSCLFSHMHWFHANPDGSVDGDIFAFLRDGKVFELMFRDGFYTSDGIKNDDLNDLKSKVTAPLFELTNSANTATNHKNLYFMIVSEKGIAYEVAADYKTNERFVSALYVFEPGADFLPMGCIDRIQSLIPVSGHK